MYVIMQYAVCVSMLPHTAYCIMTYMYFHETFLAIVTLAVLTYKLPGSLWMWYMEKAQSLVNQIPKDRLEN
jgi:hypothetical protein